MSLFAKIAAWLRGGPATPVPPVLPNRPPPVPGSAPRPAATPQRPPPVPPSGRPYTSGVNVGTTSTRQTNTPGGAPVPPRVPSPFPPPQSSRPAVKLNLDAGQFTPLSPEEIKKRAAGLTWNWASVNFDRRDQIPSAVEPRTALIDRALVAQGLLTPEQLVEIHQVGEQMAILRPELKSAYDRAHEVVALAEAERLARKAAKKAAADKKRAEHAAAVVHRKATDIIFLGRGVSGGLADRRTNIEKLQSLGLPLLAAPADIAKALGLELSRLRWLAFHSEASAVTHYVRFQIPKKSGGTRELAAPHRDMARCQEWIRTQILDRVPLHDAAHGFVAKRNTLTNATPHLQRAVVVNADLKDFFPSITFPRVKGVFQQLGYSPAAATVLALLCTECPRTRVKYEQRDLWVAMGPRGLPQGACTSPALSNLVARGLDGRIAGLARKLGWTYTRYADDLSFSTDATGAPKTAWLLARLRHIVGEENFTVNEKKTRVQRPNSQQSVTGIVVNQRANIPRETVRRLRAILHRAKIEGLAAQNRENHPNFTAWVRGMIAYVQMVNPTRGADLLAQFHELGDGGAKSS